MPKTRRNICKIPDTKQPYIRMTNNSNKEFDDIICPICIEHPHNAVLLICSSYDKGCRTYICNAPIQSACLAKFRSATSASSAASRLRCPLCRGHVIEERVVEPARRFLDSKERECREGKCGFLGTRRELMWHWWERHVGDDVAEAERRRREGIERESATSEDRETRIRRGPRMSVVGHLIGRQLASASVPDCL